MSGIRGWLSQRFLEVISEIVHGIFLEYEKFSRRILSGMFEEIYGKFLKEYEDFFFIKRNLSRNS